MICMMGLQKLGKKLLKNWAARLVFENWDCEYGLHDKFAKIGGKFLTTLICMIICGSFTTKDLIYSVRR